MAAAPDSSDLCVSQTVLAFSVDRWRADCDAQCLKDSVARALRSAASRDACADESWQRGRLGRTVQVQTTAGSRWSEAAPLRS